MLSAESNDYHIEEKELLDTIQDMGYEITPGELSIFKNEFEKFLENEDKISRSGKESSCSLFSSFLFSDSHAHPTVSNDNIEDPLVSLKDPLDCFIINNSRHSLFHQDSSSSNCGSFTDKKLFDRDSISDLIYNGYLLLEQLSTENAYLAALTKQIETVCENSESSLHHEAGVNVETPLSCPITGTKRKGDDFSSTMCAEKCYERAALLWKDAIRSVLCPPPGGLPFRHDPVKMFELYKKEWTTNPPPGENKRLSLRWKVREFMLSREIPSITYANLQKQRRENPKWTPKSYL